MAGIIACPTSILCRFDGDLRMSDVFVVIPVGS